jgi:DNA-binding IclR family transcriptional regulator
LDQEAKEKSNSLEKMLALLDLFTESNPVWLSEELIDFMGVSRSTGYRYIKTLHHSGLLAAVGNGSYILGPRILELDLQIRQSDPLYKLAGPVLQQLFEETTWPALFCVLYSDSVMCIRAVGERLPTGFFNRGQKRPLFSGAASKVILAHLPSHQINKLFLTQRTAIARAKLGTDLDTFKQRLRQIREDGYCKTTAEFSPGIVGIACPVFNRDGKILGSIGIGAQATGLRRDDTPARIENVKNAAQEINALMASIETPLDQPARAVGRASA